MCLHSCEASATSSVLAGVCDRIVVYIYSLPLRRDRYGLLSQEELYLLTTLEGLLVSLWPGADRGREARAGHDRRCGAARFVFLLPSSGVLVLIHSSCGTTARVGRRHGVGLGATVPQPAGC